jgi:putative transposase
LFNLSIRGAEDLLAERNINVSYESIRFWVNKFRSEFAHRLKRKHQGSGDACYSDEMFVRIRGKQRYLQRAVDQEDEVVGVYLQERRDAKTAKRFFQHFPAAGVVSREIIAHRLRSYGVAHRTRLKPRLIEEGALSPRLVNSSPAVPLTLPAVVKLLI